jgi:hypothetical protein
MHDKLAISKYLAEVLQDWWNSRDAFPANTYPDTQWPIPFFGNPATAVVATVGVNPSSDEFSPDRNWAEVKSNTDWKLRLKNYFVQKTPPHRWFKPWAAGLELLGLNYKDGTVAHFDVSYRSTKAMLKNTSTNSEEFRRMIERDVVWFFRLLLLCPKLRLLLIFGPIIRADGSKESLAQFVRNNAPQNGFKLLQDGKYWVFKYLDTGKAICVHEVSMPGEKDVACRVVKNLEIHSPELRRRWLV